MVADLLLVLALGVHDDLGKHLGEEILEELGSHDHLCPVVAGLQDVEYITCGGDK